MKLTSDFYNRNCVEVAKDLLGKTLVVSNTRGIITETEAYRGTDDEASHAFGGITQRSRIMFEAAGHVYVYLIYGMYHCLNIVTENEGQGAAVLVRGLMLPDIHLEGPGKICRYLNITREHSGINLFTNADMYVADGIESPSFISTPRIGIKKATDKLWRFVLNSQHLTRESISI